MKFKKLLFIPLAISVLVTTAQTEELKPEIAKQWLVAVEGDTINAEDFWYVYNKNADPNKIVTQDSLNSYRKLYDKFLLKVQEAKSLGYDTTSKFIKEFTGYKNQLAESYLKDKSVTNNLVKEAYERSKLDIEASHILIGFNSNGLPADTISAYKTAELVKELADKGTDFAELAKKYSTGPSGKSTGGYLGYFSVFRMVYPFESAAYNTEVGSVSHPFRTQFGYHIVKVHSKRKAGGEIKVAHIIARETKEMSLEKKAIAKKNIFEIYQKLQNGESFNSLARKFSEDMLTASKGGDLPPFRAGKYDPSFENPAFDLDSNGDYTKPIKTVYGWQIIQRLDRSNPKSFEEVKLDLKTKVARSDRAELSKTYVLNRIKTDYNFKEFRAGIDGFYSLCDSTLITATWKVPREVNLKEKMFEFNGETFTQLDFANYLRETLVPKRGGDYRRLVTYTYDKWVESLLRDHEKSQLYTKEPNYIRLLKEYREGIILFDLSSEKVWNKSVTDTLGLRTFHESNKNIWQWDERMSGTIYKCVNAETAKMVRKYLKKGKDDAFIIEKINISSQLNLRVDDDKKYQAKDRNELEGKTFKKGISKVYEKEGSFIVLKVDEVIPVTNKRLSEVRGSVAARYQGFLMNEWLEELRIKYKIVYNEEVFKQLIP